MITAVEIYSHLGRHTAATNAVDNVQYVIYINKKKGLIRGGGQQRVFKGKRAPLFYTQVKKKRYTKMKFLQVGRRKMRETCSVNPRSKVPRMSKHCVNTSIGPKQVFKFKL